MSGHGILRLPTRILFGPGERVAVPRLLGPAPRRVFVVADTFLATTPEFIELRELLTATGHDVSVYTEVETELPVGSLVRAGQVARKAMPDVILGYGGGSTLDAAKLIALLVAYDGPLDRYYGENAVPGPVLPVIALPTTAGTGSEVTPVAVVTDASRELKVGISSLHLIPWAAVVDPELTYGAPAAVTAYSGIDALVHAIESYTAGTLESSWPDTTAMFVGQNLLSAPLSLEAIRLIGPNLARVVHDPSATGARNAMARGSLLAGMAFGSTGTHLAHAIQYAIGALTHTPHGLGTGMMLPYVLQAISTEVPGRIRDVGRALTGRDITVTETIDAVESLNQSIGLPISLAQIGVRSTDVTQLATLSMQSERLVRIAPSPVTPHLLQSILHAAIAGDRSLIAGRGLSS